MRSFALAAAAAAAAAGAAASRLCPASEERGVRREGERGKSRTRSRFQSAAGFRRVHSFERAPHTHIGASTASRADRRSSAGSAEREVVHCAPASQARDCVCMFERYAGFTMDANL